jgi:hypothetical protein
MEVEQGAKEGGKDGEELKSSIFNRNWKGRRK